MRSALNKSDKIGAGRKVLANRYERKFRRGTLIFIEGELSTEMLILRTGSVRILKQEGENTFELAILGPGSVLGELSLLDHQPRGAVVPPSAGRAVFPPAGSRCGSRPRTRG